MNEASRPAVSTPIILRFVLSLVAIVLLTIPALAVYLSFPAAAGPVTTPPVVAGVLAGPGEVRRAGEITWSQQVGPVSLHTGDAIRVSAAVPLRLVEGSTLQLSAGTTVEIVAFAPAEQRVRLRQVAGSMQVQTTNPFLEIETPSTVAALRPATFRVTVQGAEATVAVDQGSVEGRTDGSAIPNGEGETVRIAAGQAQSVRWERAPAPTPVPGVTPAPSPTPMPTAGPPQRVYVVEQGDTLLYIAAKYKTTVEAIVRANNLDDPGTLSIGQKLIIPYTPGQ